MAGQLHPPLDPSEDIIVDGSPGGVPVVFFVDYADRRTRRVRDILGRSATRPGDGVSCIAVRLKPAATQGDATDTSARGVIAAYWQGQFAEMHEALMGATDALSDQTVRALAEGIGLDMAIFEADLASERTQAMLARHHASWEASDILQEPALFIGGRAYDGTWDATSIGEAITRPLGLRLRQASDEFFHWAASAGLVLVLATLAALLVVNVGLAEWYDHLAHLDIGLNAGDWALNLSLSHWVNDGLMALFFLLVGIEIKREIVAGELSTPGKAILPILGAIGGMLVPALLYTVINVGGDEAHGWGIPMATDIAFTLGILALLGSRVPASLKIFVSALAIADDLGAILVIALFYGHGFDLGAALWALAVLAVMAGLNVSRIYARLPYLICGVVLWYFVFQSGLHATLAGVLTAAFIPSRRSADIEGVALHAGEVIRREIGNEEIGARAMARLDAAVERLREPGFHLQHRLENWSNFLILPLFAFFNTGIVLAGGLALANPAVLGVIIGLVVGKPLGICLFVWIGLRTGLATLPDGTNWRQLFGAACLCGVGFTMSIFIASAAFEGTVLGDVKLAVLAASCIAAAVGSAILLFRPATGATAQEAGSN
ncbi:Na+/H+ antiporter NhaA [Jannaschia sp. 2305UL9-9]|uniref:Na+/H+ antiporter NhaA n=1 Tax=Jannaschia sp. 2305UL9-9 TaxID=3121638 RepID=UPI003528FDD3